MCEKIIIPIKSEYLIETLKLYMTVLDKNTWNLITL